MKQFFKFVFASFFGLVLFILFMLILIISIASFSKEGKDDFVAKQSVLHLKLNSSLNEKPSSNPLDGFDVNTLEFKKAMIFSDMLACIKEATEDKRIAGIFLDLSSVNLGLAKLEELRNSLQEFKSSKKWIVSYAENYSQKDYYLSSVADEIYLTPAGDFELKGLFTELMFFKTALDKLGVEAQIIRHGKFKGAVEPFMLDAMSDENRYQIKTLIHSVWDNMTGNIAASRGLTSDDLNTLANELTINSAQDALEHKLVDGLKYRDEVVEALKKHLETEEEEDIKYISASEYNEAINAKEEDTENPSIAIIYAEGDIISGENEEKDMIASGSLSTKIKEARLDTTIKAIVLRVNSPGGSALASDIIWREVILAKKVKPLVVSMGNVAASGGYYIACGADKIVCDKMTITGSIGVFGVIPNAKKLFNERLGINFDEEMTNEFSNMMTITKPLSTKGRAFIQKSVEKIYDDFITKVAEGRNLSKEAVDKIGQGRVWTGENALEIGLVDEIGGLEEAINIAAELANLTSFNTINYETEDNDFLSNMLKAKMYTQIKNNMVKESMGSFHPYYQQIKRISSKNGVQALMPFEIIIE